MIQSFTNPGGPEIPLSAAEGATGLEAVGPALLHLLRFGPSVEHEPELQAWIGNPAQGRALIRLAALHGVLGLTLSVLERSHLLDDLPAASAHELLADLNPLRRRAALLELEADRVLSLLRDEGMDPVVLKGRAVAGLYYDHPVERHSADLDILIQPDRIEPCLDSLRRAGYDIGDTTLEAYASFHFHYQMRNARGSVVELHWRLSEPASPFDLDAAEVMRQSVRRSTSGDQLLRVCRPEHAILHFVLQNVQEGFSRLSRLVDVDRIVRLEQRIDWDYLSRAAAPGNLGAALGLTLQMAHRMLGTPTPPDFVLGQVSERGRRKLALLQPIRSMLERRFVDHHAGYLLLRLWLIERRGSQLRQLWKILTEDQDALDHHLGIAQDRNGPLHRMGVVLKLVLFFGLLRSGLSRRPGAPAGPFWPATP